MCQDNTHLAPTCHYGITLGRRSPRHAGLSPATCRDRRHGTTLRRWWHCSYGLHKLPGFRFLGRKQRVWEGLVVITRTDTCYICSP